MNRLPRGKPRLVGIAAPPVGEVGGRGDADQPGEPVAQRLADHQHEPSAHGRADHDHLACYVRVYQREDFLAPLRQRAICEIAVARPAAGIVEQQAGAATGASPVEKRCRLAALHVRHVARQEDERRARTGVMAICDPSPVGHRVIGDLRHARIHARRAASKASGHSASCRIAPRFGDRSRGTIWHLSFCRHRPSLRTP